MGKAYKIGEFVLESKLGAGGMGVVFRARQVALQRWVALKLLSRPANSGSKFVQRFYREAQATAQLVHPNIIQTYTIGEHKGAPYFAMEYVEGRDLASILEDGALSVDEAVEVTRAVAKALGLAAEHGIVHRDIKPANIMVSKNGTPKVMDFGLAKATAIDESLTVDGQIIGTPTYMSPEQGMSKEVDARSDLYSLGCVFYESLTGHSPFEADNVPALIFKHLYEDPEPVRKLKPEVPEALEAICLKMMSKKPEERYQSSMEILEDLAKIQINSAGAELSLAKRASIPAPKGEAIKALVPDQESSEDVSKGSGVDPGTMVEDVLEGKAQKQSKGSLFGSSTMEAASEKEETERKASLAKSISKETRAYDNPGVAPTVDTAATIKIDIPFGKDFGSQDQQRSDPNDVPPPPPPSSATQRRLSARASGFSPVVESKRDAKTDSRKVAKRDSSKAQRVRASGRKDGKKGVSPYFFKDDDGRWTYDLSLGSCKYGEGVAAEAVPGGEQSQGNHGDCLVCSNWNKRVGCVLAQTQEIESKSRATGADRAEELAGAWCAIDRFDRGIEFLEEYIESFPDDPGGYLVLAKIYQRPDYTGGDRSRGIVLYGRFVELAERHGGFTTLEIKRAQDRMESLRAAGHSGGTRPAVRSEEQIPLAMFRCFYRGDRFIFYGLVLVTKKGLFAVEAGEMDPETGVSTADIGSPLQRATRIFRRMKSEKARNAEKEAIKKELNRLEGISIEQHEREDSHTVWLPLEKFQKVSYEPKETSGYKILRIYAAHQYHDLLFSVKDDLDGQRCALFLKRMTGV